MEQLAITLESGSTGSTAILRLRGPLTLSTLFVLQEKLREVQNRDTVIDVADSAYIDSAGLGQILGHWSHARRTGRKFALAGVSPRIQVLLELTKVNTILPIFRTAEQADQDFTQSAARV